MKVQYEIFESSTKSWESLAEEAALFASGLGTNLINISVTAVGGVGGGGLGADGIIIVWYKANP